MPPCPNGARPKAGDENLFVWLDPALIALDWLNVIIDKTPMVAASLVASLVDIRGICAENVDPPEPITAQDILLETAAIPTAEAIGSHAVTRKAYATLRYAQFLAHCECVPPPPPAGTNCPYANFGITLPSTQSSSPVPYSVDSVYWATYDRVTPGGANASRWSRQVAIATIPTASQVFLETSTSAAGPWQSVEDMRFTGVAANQCVFSVGQLPAPGIPQVGFMRVRNNSAVTQTIAGFSYCFCALPSVAPPLPPQPPVTDVPVPPAHACDNTTICNMISELAHRISVIAGQISDIQAAITSVSQLQVLSSQAISGEGQLNLPVGTKAISIEITALGPDAFTSALGRPRGLMRVGSVRWYDGIGYSPRRFIDGDRFDDPRPTGAVALSWQLLAGTSGILKMLI